MAQGFSFRARLKSFRYAWRGLAVLLKTQHNSRIHLAATAVVTITGFMLRLPADRWCLLIVAMALVWITEAVNTAIELLADVVSPEHHPVIGKCKDVAACAVLISAAAAAAIGAIVFLPALAHYIRETG